MSGITTHILDTSLGQPAVGVRGRLLLGETEVSSFVTFTDGRAGVLLPDESNNIVAGTYRLIFNIGEYFAAFKTPSFYPEVTICFEVRDPAAHYHVPLLISPFGYTTYRGS